MPAWARRGWAQSVTSCPSKWMLPELARSSPDTIADGFIYWGAILHELWANLDESLRQGAPPTNLYEWIETRPEVSRAFQRWMVAIAHMNAGEIVGKLKVPPAARQVIDIGGGHAMYSVALCQRYPRLRSTVIDSPEALKVAEETVAAANLGDRITLLAQAVSGHARANLLRQSCC